MAKKKKIILPPQLPPEIPEEDIEVSDEDLSFVKENRRYAGFLTNLDTNLINRHVTRVADHKEDELEALYEKQKKKAALKRAKEEEGLQVERVDALPIKTLEGELRYRTAIDDARHDAELKENDLASEVKDSDEGLIRPTKAERRQKLKKSKQETKRQANVEVKGSPAEGVLHSEILAKVEEDLSAEELFSRKKIKIAEIGMAMLENPESNISLLKELLHICGDEDRNIVKLGLMSLLAVFKDIIPGYRIRLPTDKELEMKVSKEVRQTRFYESTLLSSYKAYLLKLISWEKDPSFRCAAIRCICTLLDAAPHFNFYETLLAVVVRNISSSDEAIRKLCCETIKSIFTNGGKHGGKATLDAVQLISELVKTHDCQLHPDSIEVFLSLVFDEELGKSEPKKEEKGKSKKKKRKQKLERSNELPMSESKRIKYELMEKTRAELSADLRSVSFAPDINERISMQSEILNAVFQTYFRVLKSSMVPSPRPMVNDVSLSGGQGPHPLLGPCLSGLGKFSHLIDLDFMGDLMVCLKKLAGYGDSHSDSSNSLTVSEKLQCCIVAFRVMRNNLDALNVDLQGFFVQLYKLLLEYRPFRDRSDVLVEALKTMLWEGRQHDMHRAAAFVKRLATFALSFGSPEAMAALVTVKHLLLKNSKCRNLLENDPGGGSLSGLVVKYNPDATDPILSGALSSVLWELSLLAKHHNPSIAASATSISSMVSMKPSQTQPYLSNTSPSEAFESLNIERELSRLARQQQHSVKPKGRRGAGEFIILDAERVRSLESAVDFDELERKFEEHFTVLREFAENTRLRSELNRTSSALRMFEEYKRERKKMDGKLKRNSEPQLKKQFV